MVSLYLFSERSNAIRSFCAVMYGRYFLQKGIITTISVTIKSRQSICATILCRLKSDDTTAKPEKIKSLSHICVTSTIME